MWQLTFGVDMPGLSEPNLVNESFAPLYRLFNKYSGSIRPPAEDWVGGVGRYYAQRAPRVLTKTSDFIVWCLSSEATDSTNSAPTTIVHLQIIMLRDGLDSANTARFPESQFGTASPHNQQRLLAIASAYAGEYSNPPLLVSLGLFGSTPL
jgi:hypothetical protein